MSTNLDNVETNLASPAKASSDGMTIEQHDIESQLKVAKQLDQQTAADNVTHRGLRFNKIVPPGSV